MTYRPISFFFFTGAWCVVVNEDVYQDNYRYQIAGIFKLLSNHSLLLWLRLRLLLLRRRIDFGRHKSTIFFPFFCSIDNIICLTTGADDPGTQPKTVVNSITSYEYNCIMVGAQPFFFFLLRVTKWTSAAEKLKNENKHRHFGWATIVSSFVFVIFAFSPVSPVQGVRNCRAAHNHHYHHQPAG